ncbi:hypothetical protein HanPI659440_Chr08g0285581 [Helianthus annuus]|nr:hypothetical protein HanPI659440_Chr08g0285581 [Helianthus annuus]
MFLLSTLFNAVVASTNTIINIENRVSDFDKCSWRYISKVVIIKKVSSHFTKTRFTNPNRPFQPGLTKRLTHEPFRVVGRKRLFIGRFHNRYALTFTVPKIISTSKPTIDLDRVNTGL